MEKNEYFTLSNGVQVPAIGFGTWQIPNGTAAYDSVAFALKNGYKHIDTANAYGNEASVGKAVRDSGIARNELFITSKLPAELKTYDMTLKRFDETMKNLGTDYLDLYLIHAPWPWNEMGADYTKENIQVWKAMEEIYKSGRCRAIGVSNFNVSDLTAILESCTVKPMANQIRFFIGNTQEEITRFSKQHDILVEGYSPLATGKIIGNETLEAIANKYNRTVAQLSIRYVLQCGVLPLPKSTTPDRILQNIEVDFEIGKEDMNFLNSLKNTDNVLFSSKKKV